jgi:hypothetical protein
MHTAIAAIQRRQEDKVLGFREAEVMVGTELALGLLCFFLRKEYERELGGSSSDIRPLINGWLSQNLPDVYVRYSSAV